MATPPPEGTRAARARAQPLLLIGPGDRHPRFLGGATTSLGAFKAFLEREGVALRWVDTRRCAGRWHEPVNLLGVLALVAVATPRARVVVFFAARRGVLWLAPLLHLYCALWRRRFCLHPVGGDLLALYGRCPAWHRWLLRRTVFAADPLLLETRALLDSCAALARRPAWFPNTRPRPARTNPPGPYRRRFVFMSQVTEEKGVGVLLEARAALGPAFTVDVFGPVRDGRLASALASSGCYRGVVAPGDVLDVLRGYDVLVLPTFAPEEGHPGAIIEAFSIAMPVIATAWRSIPEIVVDGVSGLLVPPRSATALADAMRSIDETTLSTLRDGARRAFDPFESDRVHRDVLAVILHPGRTP